MIRRNLILALIVVAQLIASVLVFVLPGQATTAAAKPLLESFKAADVSQITLCDKNDQQLQLARKDAGWVLPQSDDFPVEVTKVTTFLDKLAAVQTSRLIATTPASQSRLQVADDTFNRRVDLTGGDALNATLIVLAVGAKDAANSAVTVKVSTSPYIVNISSFTVEDLPTLTALSFAKVATVAPQAPAATP